MDWTSCDWGGFTSVLSSLDFWRGWLTSSLKHSQRGTEGAVLLRFFQTADPLASAVAIALLLAALCFLLSLPTNRHSWVDKLWSVAPVYYFWHFAMHDQLQGRGVPVNARLLAMATLASVWGVRLTYNFARKGGYRWHDEDYRWPWLRARVHWLPFLVFNLTFIAVIQHLLLLALCAPAYLAWQNVSRPVGPLDAAAAALVAFFLLFEATADEQQWAFQTAKHALLRAGKPLPPLLARGFCTTGLFRYSRHPNFWAEQGIWWSMYLFGVAASGRWLNWTIVGPLFLSLLFQGSTWLTELISSAKYPSYADYQKTTSRLMPWFPGEPALLAEGQAESEEEEQKEPEQDSDDNDDDEEEEEEQPRPARSARKPRASSRRVSVAAKPAATPAAKAKPAEQQQEGQEAADGSDEEQQEKPAPRSRNARSAAAGAAAKRGAAVRSRAAKASENAPAAEEGPAESARPSRSPRKSAKAAVVAEAPVATRHSSRLRAKVTAA
ncbi:hypothetical protein ABPG75_006352 [Micractinium tetrahymenae]